MWFWKPTFKPVRHFEDFLLIVFILIPAFVVANLGLLTGAIWVAWHGVSSYWTQVRMITWLQALEFAVGLSVVLYIVKSFIPSKD